MKRSKARILLFLLSVALAFFASATLADQIDDADLSGIGPAFPMHERVLSVPVGPDLAVHLQVTLFEPVSGGPFPLVVMNHGASADPRHTPRLTDNFATYYFLSRGYAVALPMMRGYAQSEGHFPAHGCDLVAAGLEAAHDIATVIDFVTQQPGIDGSRIVVAGKSMGGWNTLALGTLNLPNIKGLVSFAGGMGESDCHSPDASLVSGAGQLGAHSKIPSIWFFGDNDKIFATPTWRAMFKQYTDGGAPAELVDFGTFMDDAHTITASGAGLPLWAPKLDTFLAKLGLPGQDVLAIYLPASAPAASSYADLKDLAAVPFSDPQQAAYRHFLAAPLPRAIAIGRTGAGMAAGGFDPSARALQACWAQTQYCQLYAVDNAVVWPRLAGEPPRTNFAALPDASAVPYLNGKGRAGYANFLLTRRPRAFAIAPDGNWAAASSLDPITDALVACSQGHSGCRLYAVDGDVVWPGK